MLQYAVIADRQRAVCFILRQLRELPDWSCADGQRRLIESVVEAPLRREVRHGGIVLSVGMTVLCCAMKFASPRTVEILLNFGASPERCCKGGLDSFMHACVSGNLDCIEYWVCRFPKWNLNRVDKHGRCALHLALNMQPRALPIAKILLRAGSNVFNVDANGRGLIFAVCDNEDSTPNLLKLVLEQMCRRATFSEGSTGDAVNCEERTDKWLRQRMRALNFSETLNRRIRARTRGKRARIFLAKCLYRFGVPLSARHRRLALMSGATALHAAAARGDVRLVHKLLHYGADPKIRTDVGMDARAFCREMGPFPGVDALLASWSSCTESAGSAEK